jgi:hypothetical protein
MAHTDLTDLCTGDYAQLEKRMALVTNRLGLPAPLVNALKNQRYSRGASQASVTELIDAPRISQLRKSNQSRIKYDVADRLWALLGTALHAVLEQGGDTEHLPEERLFAEVSGWIISGGIDLQHLQRGAGNMPLVGLRDYKLTSAWSLLTIKPAWVNQINSYAWLIRTVKGWDVEDAKIVVILRDWNKREAQRSRDYPQTPIVQVPVELWSPETADAYIRERVRLHQDADRRRQWGEELPLCTAEERWARPDTWAVMRVGRKRASRVFHSSAEATAYHLTHPGTEVQFRPGSSVRCAGDYCGVSRWCDQWAALSPYQGDDEHE